MGTSEALELLVRDWTDIHGSLGPALRQRVDTLAGELAAEPIPEEVSRKAGQLCRLVAMELPRTHPFRTALTDDGTRFVRTGDDPDSLARWFRTRDALRSHVDLELRPPAVAEVDHGATTWLLSQPSFTESEVRQRDADPHDPGLIRLTGPGRVTLWPAFQFGAHRKLVRRINHILDAAGDPWGAADWWLGPHAWLPGVPARLLGSVDDQELVEAAEAEQAED